jgi:SpoVK/Ycf46/Vps4 family AAA+-type ATPase
MLTHNVLLNDCPPNRCEMPTAQQLLALIKSHVKGDDERFYSLVLQLAASEAKRGHAVLAEQLKELLEQAKSPRPRVVYSHGPVPVPSVRSDLASILSVQYPKTLLSNMVLDENLMAQLRRIVYEQRQRARLKNHGLNARRKLLLTGPPGSGKTMTVSALAGELGLPLFSVLLHGILTKFMGEAAAKLRLIFDAMTEMRGVYLFDEIDALGGKRDAENDVGEARRILNSFLQFLEQDHSDALIVATTNHESLLDRALFRRFQAILKYKLPSLDEISRAMKMRLQGFDVSEVEWPIIAREADGLSHAEITAAAEDAARNAILDHGPEIHTSDLSTAVASRKNLTR